MEAVSSAVSKVLRDAVHVRAVFDVAFAAIFEDVHLFRCRNRERSGLMSTGGVARGRGAWLVQLIDDGANIGTWLGRGLLGDIGK